jgi:hypothetical protein
MSCLDFMELKVFLNFFKKKGVGGSANRPVGHSKNLGLIHTAVRKMIVIIIQKKTPLNTTKDIWEFLLQHFWAEVGHHQAAQILQYTKKKCCTTSCLNVNEIPFLQLTILYIRVIRVYTVSKSVIL